MFNFGGPPSYLAGASSSGSNYNTNKSRMSVSDMGLNNLKNQQLQQHQQSQSQSHFQSQKASSLTLPPITKTKSLTVAPGHPANSLRLGRPPPDEPKKRPNHREMITLTLKHVQSARGLNFEQLSCFIRGAFDLPKTSAVDSTLSKTLSNMVSRGYVMQIPGLGAYDATYQLAETLDPSGLDLSVRGRSVQEVPCWPSGYSLPNGRNLLCRSAKQQSSPSASDLAARGRGAGDPNPYRRNPMNMKLDPLPYMPVSDPMLCQSFGARVGLSCKMDDTQRPNSPNCEESTQSGPRSRSRELGFPRDPEFNCNYPYKYQDDYKQSMWTPLIPHADDDDDNDDSTENNKSNNCSNSSPGSKVKEIPRVLDTFTECCTLEEFYKGEEDDQDEEEDDSDKYKDQEEEDQGGQEEEEEEAKVKGQAPISGDENEEEVDKTNCKSSTSFEEEGSLKGRVDGKLLESRLSKLVIGAQGRGQASQRPLRSRMMMTLAASRARTSRASQRTTTTIASSCSSSKQLDADPLENFDIFASYGGETKEEIEANNRSCQIMNDFGRRDVKGLQGGQGQGENELEFEKRMDYLYGLADIIDSYEEKPPSLRGHLKTAITSSNVASNSNPKARSKDSLKGKTYRK